jgi:prepilin-type N-terminal cleavage/methylation domain-containing protein
MKRFAITTQQSDIQHVWRQTGVTLIEVLMSLMIMSIGVASVAALFPISVLRTVQANQLTNGAIVKYNVEAMLQSDPSWIVDPDRDGNLVEHFRNPQDRNYFVDPIGFYTHFANGDYVATATIGNNGASSAGLLRRWGGGLSTLPESANTNSAVFDPFGIYRVRVDNPPNPVQAIAPPAARYSAALRLAAISKAGQGDGWTTDFDVVPVSLVTSPDGVVGAVLPPPADLDLSQMATSATVLPAGTAPSAFLVPDPELYRVVLFSVDGKRSQAYPLTSINTTTNTVSWSEDTNADGTGDSDFNMSGTVDSQTDIRPLPVEFGGTVSRVLLQSRRLTDFSWMLTVRRRSDGFVRGTDIVVRTKNGADLKDERLFDATFIKDTNIIGIRYPYRTNPADTTIPSLRRGKFVFDAQNALWYRIQDYKERPLGNIGWSYPEYDAVVYTETEIAEPAGEDQFTLFDSTGLVPLLLNGGSPGNPGIPDSGQYVLEGGIPVVQSPFTMIPNTTPPFNPPEIRSPLSEDMARPGDNDGVLDFGAAIFPSGVVDVYPMGSMPLPSSL